MYHVSAQGVDERMINVHYIYIYLGVNIAQLVERTTEKPGAMPTRVRIPGAARDFPPRPSFQSGLSYAARTAPVCNRMHPHMCAHPKTGSRTIVWTHEDCTHQ